MISLRELQEHFLDAIARADGATLASGDEPADTAERLAIYRRTIRANYRNALAATYPVVRRLCGSSMFDGAVDAFVVAHPSRAGDLNVYGDRFGDFLAMYPAARERPH